MSVESARRFLVKLQADSLYRREVGEAIRRSGEGGWAAALQSQGFSFSDDDLSYARRTITRPTHTPTIEDSPEPGNPPPLTIFRFDAKLESAVINY